MKLFIKLTVALLLASLVLVGPAGAATNISTKTKLTASDKTIRVDQKVTFKVRVTSKNKKCFKNQKIKWFKNGHFKKYRQLNAKGKAKFTLNFPAAGTKKYQAKYPGREFGTHPNHHICKKSHSKVIKIQVKPKK